MVRVSSLLREPVPPQAPVPVQASAAEYLAARTFPCLRRFRCTLALAVMVAVGALIGSPSESTGIYAASGLAVLLIVPAEALIKGGIRKHEKA